MIRSTLFVCIMVILTACVSSEGKAGDVIASQEVSPGGLAYRLLFVPDKKEIAIHVAWQNDWAYQDNTNKAAPLVGTQLILAGGAQGYPVGEVAERFVDLKAEGDIYVLGNDHIIGELLVDPEHLNETIEIANAHLRVPTLDPMWLDRIRYGLAENVAETRSHPASIGFEAVRWAVFGEQPMRNSLSFDEPGVFESLSRDDILAWHTEAFTRTPEAIVVAGGIDAKTAGRAIDALFKGLPETSRDRVGTTSPDFSPRRILLHQPEPDITYLAFIATLPPSRMGGEIEDLILIHALGGDDQSVLFSALRIELGASYAFGSGIQSYTRENRYLVMVGEVQEDKVSDSERVVREAYAAFREAGPEGDLSQRKAMFEEFFTSVPEHVDALASVELQGALDANEVGLSLSLMDELASVDESSIMNRLKNDFPEEHEFIVVVVSPNADALPNACVISAPREAVDCP